MVINQIMFDVDNYDTRQECIKAKNEKAKELRSQGRKVISGILKNQQRGYSGFGSARDTSVRDVFMLSIIN